MERARECETSRRSFHLRPAAEVIPLTPRKRTRGRPKKPRLAETPCQDSFLVVAAAVAGLAERASVWAAAKEQVRHHVDRVAGLSPNSLRVMGFYLEHLSRAKGFDWHSAAAIADDLCISVSSVERANRELTMVGCILRATITCGGSRSSKRWRTTIPSLLGCRLARARTTTRQWNSENRERSLANRRKSERRRAEWKLFSSVMRLKEVINDGRD
jgi:hypothetical protein